MLSAGVSQIYTCCQRWTKDRGGTKSQLLSFLFRTLLLAPVCARGVTWPWLVLHKAATAAVSCCGRACSQPCLSGARALGLVPGEEETVEGAVPSVKEAGDALFCWVRGVIRRGGWRTRGAPVRGGGLCRVSQRFGSLRAPPHLLGAVITDYDS